MKPIETLDLLNFYLNKQGIVKKITICGGSVPIIKGISLRSETKDIDIIIPLIDEQLKSASILVAEKIGLQDDWINNGPEHLASDLDPGWEERVEQIYTNSNLIIFSLSREDLIFSKFYAYCDRMEKRDLLDLMAYKATSAELSSMLKKVHTMDASEFWPNNVNERLKEILEVINED